MMGFYVLPNTMPSLFLLKLYTTSCCHLCEEAFTLLIQLGLTDQLSCIEITSDEKLLEQYGTCIPVLQRSDNLAELNWPFTEKDIIDFIKV